MLGHVTVAALPPPRSFAGPEAKHVERRVAPRDTAAESGPSRCHSWIRRPRPRCAPRRPGFLLRRPAMRATFADGGLGAMQPRQAADGRAALARRARWPGRTWRRTKWATWPGGMRLSWLRP